MSEQRFPSNISVVAGWGLFMSGLEIDVVSFVDTVLDVARVQKVSGELIDLTRAVLAVGERKTEVVDELMQAKLRMVCARLAIVFDAPPYGGTTDREVEVRGRVLRAQLTFANRSGNVRFSVVPNEDA